MRSGSVRRSSFRFWRKRTAASLAFDFPAHANPAIAPVNPHQQSQNRGMDMVILPRPQNRKIMIRIREMALTSGINRLDRMNCCRRNMQNSRIPITPPVCAK